MMNEAPPMTPRQKVLALIGVNLTILMSTLDVSIVNVALPSMVKQLDTNFAMIQWIMISYLLVITSLMLSVSRLGDMLGKKRLFLFGLVLFTVASLLCGLAPTVGWLIGFRALQGVGAVMTQALGAAIIAEVVSPSELGQAMGWVGGTVSLGLTAGPSLGGILVGLVGWRSIFLINVPVGIIAWWVVTRNVPESPLPEKRERFDVPGAIIIFVALGCYALGMTMGQDFGFEKNYVLALLAAGLIGTVFFIWWQNRSDHPMLEMSLFKNPLLSLNLLMSSLVFIGMGCVYILPFFFELVLGYAPEMIGLMMVVVPACMGLVSPLAGKLADKFGGRTVAPVGLTLFIIGALCISGMGVDSTGWEYVLRALPMGLGLGFFQAPNNSAIMGQAPRHRLGVVSGLMNYSRTVGQTTGIPLQGAIFTAVVLAHAKLPERTEFSIAPKEALVEAFSNAFYVVAALGFVSLCLSFVAFRVEKKRQDAARAA